MLLHLHQHLDYERAAEVAPVQPAAAAPCSKIDGAGTPAGDMGCRVLLQRLPCPAKFRTPAAPTAAWC